MSIEEKLKGAWRQERRFVHLRGAARFVIWLIALILVDLAVDFGVIFKARLPGGARYLLLGMNVVILLWVLWNEWLKHLRPFDAVRVALEVERQHPELASVLVSYTQMDGPVESQPNVSTALIQAMREQAISLTKPLDFREVVDFGQLKKLLAVCGAVLIFFSFIGATWSGHLQSLFLRLAGVDTRYPTATTIESVTGDRVLRSGDSLLLEAAVSGVIPEQGRLLLRTAQDSRWRELPLERSESLAFGRRLNEVVDGFQYYVRVGDDHSEMYRVTVVNAPEVTASSLTYTFPDYMQREPQTLDTGELNLEVPEGTTIRWELSCTPAVQAMTVRVGEEEIAAKIDDDGHKASFELTATEGLRYAFHWVEKSNGFEFDDVQYGVRVIPDRMPVVELQEPAAGGLATDRKVVQVKARASDDHGLQKAWLVYSVDGRDESRIEIHDFAGRPGGEIAYSWSLKETIPDLALESVLTFSLEVTDAYPPAGTHTALSAARRLTIVDPARYLEWFRDELDAQREEIARARDSELKAATEVRQLLTQERPTEPN